MSQKIKIYTKTLQQDFYNITNKFTYLLIPILKTANRHWMKMLGSSSLQRGCEILPEPVFCRINAAPGRRGLQLSARIFKQLIIYFFHIQIILIVSLSIVMPTSSQQSRYRPCLAGGAGTVVLRYLPLHVLLRVLRALLVKDATKGQHKYN